jgi:Uncharacterized proteins of the AP superfamily
MKIIYPDYNNCIVNLSNSILKYYQAEYTHNTLPELDKYLEKDYKNIIVLLYDGFGSNLIKNTLGEQSFLHSNKIKDITSVFPATTTASTTSIITGLTPVEHCWLGWNNYIKSIDKVVTMFWNVIKDTNRKAADFNIVKQEFPYTTIFDKINKTKNAKAYCISPFEGLSYNADNVNEMYDSILKLCKTNEKKFIYAYCHNPDKLMHDHGTKAQIVIDKIHYLNKKTEELSNKLTDDTLLIITADHGHMDIGEHIILNNYPKLKNMLTKDISLEARATNFFVKDNLLKEFKKEFIKLFSNDFILLSRQEVINQQLFGTPTPNEQFYDCLGDYIAIGISDKIILSTPYPTPIKGEHAGITTDEVLIPLIVIDKKT